MDWDDAYDNMGHVPGATALPACWAEEAANYRASGIPVDLDIPYGTSPRERLDIVWPEVQPKGLAVFIHGGYWMKLSKSDWTHLAEGAHARGWAVALPSYTLAPDARISAMTRQIGAAITCAAERVEGPIRLSGHSAGGHLACRMICTNTPLPVQVRDRIEAVVSISGLHDLRPLLRTRMNATLDLDLEEARAESPALLEPCDIARLTAWVGGGERPEFIRQSELIASIWSGLGCDTALRIDGDHHHFSVIEGMRDPASPLSEALLGT
ncbi:alpha/beta hydrolase [Amaricoccus macauensis]|uniref:alpha/beta hydrolase n=1 Tax=Amaricoccus macauensis TaxID=57001 RepID=UPI003C7CC80B